MFVPFIRELQPSEKNPMVETLYFSKISKKNREIEKKYFICKRKRTVHFSEVFVYTAGRALHCTVQYLFSII
jgi:hypothetical protein